jgi:hypothetical protein
MWKSGFTKITVEINNVENRKIWNTNTRTDSLRKETKYCKLPANTI